MKKLFALVLAVMLVVSMATIASAASTTTLTTTVPAATYTLNIPANQAIPFGATSTEIGSLSATETDSFTEGKNLVVTMSFDAFASQGVDTTIPYLLQFYFETSVGEQFSKKVSGDSVRFFGQNDGTVTLYPQATTPGGESRFDMDCICLCIETEDWAQALPGEYTSTITFTADVVVEE